jgi:hypothetical protein
LSNNKGRGKKIKMVGDLSSLQQICNHFFVGWWRTGNQLAKLLTKQTTLHNSYHHHPLPNKTNISTNFPTIIPRACT